MIELLMSDGKKVLVNLFQIQLLMESREGCHLVAGGESISIKQSYAEVCSVISEASK